MDKNYEKFSQFYDISTFLPFVAWPTTDKFSYNRYLFIKRILTEGIRTLSQKAAENFTLLYFTYMPFVA